ncbi:Aldehyde/histidinol dehydrogenase [Multifurca ochricompacta]|uniref:succinate-semialdehyde dehydrogenase [NAD(P)(+)] n=1 Tax=Multifurca ochricompacta TaxID=376703 RepID=A0AAD4MB40_9AGAM|nr:Aldehyde/histidinol dehydrogenase [Multifurca ochricompacta]
MSVNGVEWTPGMVCVFDGLENVTGRVVQWYEQRLESMKAGEELREQNHPHLAERPHLDGSFTTSLPLSLNPQSVELPGGIELVEAEPIVDRKSVFVGRACRISDPSQVIAFARVSHLITEQIARQVPLILAFLMADRRVTKAAHPIINAWRCQLAAPTVYTHPPDNGDDGESAAGGRLAHLLQILDVKDVLVVVTRYFGGTLLGADRFKHINQAARDALELGGFIELGLREPSLLFNQGLIGGKWVESKSGATISVFNPATGEKLGTVPEMGLEETKEAINAAGRAFTTWSKTTAKQRHDILIKFYNLMKEHDDDLARIITHENGKTLAEAKGESAYSASFIEWFAEEAVRTYGEHIPSPFGNIRNIVIKQPVGVVSILTPWNFPSAMIARKLGAALAAGCTTVIKPPPETPFSALALAELGRRAGIPDGVINVVTTQKNVNDVAKEMCESKTVKKVTFTGSTPVAKLLYKMAASTIKKISIEAGGNAPFIVFDDANIEQAVEGAILCKFRGTGQTCVCANRIYVQSNVYAEFASRLAERVAAFKVGNGLEEGITHGPLIHDRAVEKVMRHVNDAVEKGAQILVGGSRIDRLGTFFAPTVLSDVPANALVNDEETFGPIAALTKFETEEEVIKLANDTDVGLAGYFYSRDVGRAWRVAEALEVGMVGANTGLISQTVIPFGGIKESGIGSPCNWSTILDLSLLGREGGHGIEEYMNTKLIAFGGL